jgi:protein tyrosine phosphatase (PTP) superfamily phosphohydrolase (DUF442 family)
MCSAALAQSGPSYKELPNFQKVDDNLYRGGQPARGGIKRLAELGVKTVINLRGAGSLERAERKEAGAAGLRYFSIPLAGWGRPDDRRVAQVMTIINAAENWPVFIHCKRGSDRTGVIVALYRISHDEWTGRQAVAEARQHGMSWLSIWMKDYISDFYRSYSQRSPATAHSAAGAQGAGGAQAGAGYDDGIDDKIGRYMRSLEFLAGKTQTSLRWLFGKADAH